MAAAVSSLVCFPRLALWPNRPHPIWYLEAVLLLGGFVLWGFVFAWHTHFTNRPVFTLNPGIVPFVVATVAGILAALMLHLFVDPEVRVTTPEDYPENIEQWFAMTLFSLGFNQLFLTFAPFDWSLRLSRKRWIAILFTVLFGVFVLVIKTRSSSVPIAPSLLCALMVVRTGGSFLSVWFYSRHGAVLSWWWAFLLQTRHLLDVSSDS